MIVEVHTVEHQREYLEKEMQEGKQMYMLIKNVPVGIVSLKEDMIENLYILPERQCEGCSSELLRYVMGKCNAHTSCERRSEMLHYKEFDSTHLESVKSIYEKEQWYAYLQDDEKLKRAFDHSLLWSRNIRNRESEPTFFRQCGKSMRMYGCFRL